MWPTTPSLPPSTPSWRRGVVAGLFKDDDYRYFWIVSMPEHSGKVPFSAFVLSQDELMAYKDLYNSVIISDNVVDIWTGTVIKLPVY